MAQKRTEPFRKQGGVASMYAAEFDGLKAIRAAGVRAPEPYRCGDAFIEMERLQLGARADWPALATMLASLHRHAAPRFGWHADNWIGLSPQKNAWAEDWPSYFLEFRLTPQLERAGLKTSFHIEKLFDTYKPQPSLLHGDLWSGNVGFTPEGPVIFDPAVYFGDREADLAMTELFGGFPPAFYSAYDAAWPRDSGYAVRKELYNLYHLLNHLNLFGSGYRGQVEAALGRLRDGL
jgi:protein-ribulosamine 3-kinase